MQINGIPFHEITLEHLEQLAWDRVPESATHDYKRMVPPPEDKRGCGRFLRLAAAFANTQGGDVLWQPGATRT